MQGSKSRPGSSETQQRTSPSSPNPKRSPSPKTTRGSSASSDTFDSRASRVHERMPSPMSQSLQEKQRTTRVSEMQQQLGHVLEDLKRAKEERSRALEELAELKKRSEGSTNNNDRMMALEIETEKAKEAEMKMLDSLVSQTKQLEQTKILLEEAKLDIKNLRESPGTSEKKGLLASVQTIQAQEEIRKLRHELRLAMEAEEKSRKAMDDFAIALKEVTTEATLAKKELAARKPEAEKARLETELANSLLQGTKQKLQEALEGYDKLKLAYEESSVAWKTKQDSFINCMKISEEDIEKKNEEISRLAEAHNTAKEENSKLRDIIKQAVNEAMVVKESLEIARNENYELNEKLSEKESALQKIRQEYESLKDREVAALDSIRQLKSLLASASVSDSKPASKLMEIESSKESKATTDDRKISRNAKKFPSDRWTSNNLQTQNGSRHSVEGTDMFERLALGREAVFGSNDKRSSSNGFNHIGGVLIHDIDNDKQKKKKTVFGRFGDALRRRSFRKT